MTQFDDSENLDNTGILEMDLAKINIPTDESLSERTNRSGKPQSDFLDWKIIDQNNIFAVIALSELFQKYFLYVTDRK